MNAERGRKRWTSRLIWDSAPKVTGAKPQPMEETSVDTSHVSSSVSSAVRRPWPQQPLERKTFD